MPTKKVNRGLDVSEGELDGDSLFGGIDLIKAQFGGRTPIAQGADGTVSRRQVEVAGRSLSIVEKNGWGRLIIDQPGLHMGIDLPIYWPFRPRRQLRILKDLKMFGVDTVDFYPQLICNRVIMEDLTEGGNPKIKLFDLRKLTSAFMRVETPGEDIRNAKATEHQQEIEYLANHPDITARLAASFGRNFGRIHKAGYIGPSDFKSNLAPLDPFILLNNDGERRFVVADVCRLRKPMINLFRVDFRLAELTFAANTPFAKLDDGRFGDAAEYFFESYFRENPDPKLVEGCIRYFKMESPLAEKLRRIGKDASART
jgi:hypothetical protein